MSELEKLRKQLESIKQIWNEANDSQEVDYVGNGDWIDELDEAINPLNIVPEDQATSFLCKQCKQIFKQNITPHARISYHIIATDEDVIVPCNGKLVPIKEDIGETP